jgi:hypothetical protein
MFSRSRHQPLRGSPRVGNTFCRQVVATQIARRPIRGIELIQVLLNDLCRARNTPRRTTRRRSSRDWRGCERPSSESDHIAAIAPKFLGATCPDERRLGHARAVRCRRMNSLPPAHVTGKDSTISAQPYHAGARSVVTIAARPSVLMKRPSTPNRDRTCRMKHLLGAGGCVGSKKHSSRSVVPVSLVRSEFRV